MTPPSKPDLTLNAAPRRGLSPSGEDWAGSEEPSRLPRPSLRPTATRAVEAWRAAFANNPGKDLPMAGKVFCVQGRTAFLIPPEHSGVGKGTPWVWYAPTLPGLPGPEETWMFEKFLKAGIVIAGIDVGESYGSPAGRALYSAFYEDLVRNRGLSKTPCLLVRSRGGLMLYNWAVEHPESVACIAGIYPVCDLRSFPGLTNACGAYGLTEEELRARLAEHNPMERLASLAKAHVPIYHIHGDSDTVVPLETNSGELAARYRQLGGAMTLNVVAGQGHNMWPGWFQCQALVDFVIAQVHRSGQGASAAGSIYPRPSTPLARGSQGATRTGTGT